MNQQEIRDLKKHGHSPDNIVKPAGQTISGLIIMSNGSKELHDSGYPFIRIYGIIKDGLVDLGWHDHYVSNVPINVDSLGKNIFHVFLWCARNKCLKVKDNFMSFSSFQIGEMFGDKENDEFIFVE